MPDHSIGWQLMKVILTGSMNWLYCNCDLVVMKPTFLKNRGKKAIIRCYNVASRIGPLKKNIHCTEMFCRETNLENGMFE